MRVIDLFAGAGGFSLGAQAAGATLVAAANHWPLAVEAHALQFPKARHICQDLRQADWRDFPDFELLLASPACQGNSTAANPARARDGKVRRAHDALRATAWAVVDCVEVCRPRGFVVENVVSFARWKLYPHWLEMLRTLGYHIEEHRLLASDHGVPQLRRRLFITGVLSGRKVEIPRPTRGARPAFGPSIEWGCPADLWKPFEQIEGEAARARAELGVHLHGRRFFGQHVGRTQRPVWAPTEPLRTLTTQDQVFVVQDRRYRLLTIPEMAAGMGFPRDFRWPDRATRGSKIKGFGNAVCPPQAADVVRGLMAAA